MGRTILGAVAGLATAFVTIMLVEFASHAVYPPPPGIDPANTADMARLIGTLPMGALLMIVVAWVVGAFDGGFVAALLAGSARPRMAALAPGLMVTAGVVGMILAMPAHPAWMAVAGLLLPVPAALAGGALATAVRARRRA
jgi:hypothetical protein